MNKYQKLGTILILIGYTILRNCSGGNYEQEKNSSINDTRVSRTVGNIHSQQYRQNQRTNRRTLIMPGSFGTPENNNILTIQESYAQAISQGYLAQLQAYGVGKGLTQEEAENKVKEEMGVNIHPQQAETFREIRESIDSARREKEKEDFLNYKDNAVSMGVNNVKEETPTSGDVPKAQTEGEQK